MATSTVKPSLLQALKRFTSCDVGDALVKLKVPYGGYLSGLKMWSPEYCSGSAQILGPAHIVRMVHASDNTAPKPKEHFADTITQGSVVFVSQPKGLISACWGGLMSTRATKLGAAGVIIDGRFRDINEHRELGIGLFARDISILGSNTFTRSSEINVPVEYQLEGINDHIIINPGDILLGDSDGVCAIPPALVSQCIELCQERAEIDAKTVEALRNGEDIGPTIARLRK